MTAILDASCDRLWLVADGRVQTFDGDLDDYEAQIMAARSDSGGEAGGTAAGGARPRPVGWLQKDGKIQNL